MNEAHMETVTECLRTYLSMNYDEARTMPPEFYTSETQFEHERERLFRSEWICLGRVQQIPNAGDYFTTTSINEPLIVVRTKPDEIAVLSNVCRHRGTVLAEGNGNTKSFVCPYHAWTYNLDGQLRRAPLLPNRPDFDQHNCRLPTFSSEVWGGFIYVNLDGTADPLSPQLDGLSKLTQHYHMDDMVELHAETSIWDTNWKCLTENFMEGYHLSTVHRKTLHPITPTRLCSHFPAGEGYFGYFSVFPTDLPRRGKYHPDLTDEEQQRSVMFAVPPLHVAGLAGHKMSYLYLQPEYAGTVRVQRGLAFSDPNISEHDFKNAVDLFEQTMAEDNNQLDRLQRGLQSLYLGTAPLAPANYEGNVWDFYHYLARKLL